MGGLALPSNAVAATVTIGATAPPGTSNNGGCTGSDDFQTSTAPTRRLQLVGHLRRRGRERHLDASASTSAGTISDYHWDFGDGTTLC